MYPEGGDSGAAPADNFGGSAGSKFGMHLEGLIPLILIIIIGFFLAVRFDAIDQSTPLIGPIVDIFDSGSKQTKMLIIGATSREVIEILNDNRSIVDYDLRTTQSVEKNPKQILSNY